MLESRGKCGEVRVAEFGAEGMEEDRSGSGYIETAGSLVDGAGRGNSQYHMTYVQHLLLHTLTLTAWKR